MASTRLIRQRPKSALLVIGGVVALLAAFVSLGAFLASAPQANAARPHVTGSGQPASITAAAQQVSMSTRSAAPAAAARANADARDLPFRTKLDAAAYARAKANAKKSAPLSDHRDDAPPLSVTASFAGVQSSAAVCPPVGCNPPDMGLAVSPRWVLQGVNTAYAVFDTHGVLQPGWPKTFPDFFGIPSPGACADGGIAFTSDPRAFYDPNDDRFVAAALEVEGAFGVNDCPFTTLYWIAVSQTNDPRGGWNVYAFDMSLGTTNGADFTRVGFDGRAFYFAATMFNQEGTAFEYDEIFGASKADMEAGRAVTARGFFNLTVTGPAGSTQVDTIQPVLTEDRGRGPGAELFADTFNGFDPVSGHGCTSDADACRGLALWTLSGVTSGSPRLAFAYVGNTKAYAFPPPADQTTCTQCIDSSDLRISATPIYRDGTLYAAWETAVDNGTQVVPGILWSQVRVGVDDRAFDGATQVAGDYFNFGGDDAVVYPALMPDGDGNLYMVFDHMGSATNPEVRLTARQGGDFRSPGLLIKPGEAPYRPTRCGHDIPVCRWGDYSATSYDGFAANHVWFAGQYANGGAFSRNWGTWIGRVPGDR